MKSIALFCIAAIVGQAAWGDAPRPGEDSITVKVLGTLHTGIIAIGGETTGTTITSKGITWELDFGKNSELRGAAKYLDGQKAVVEGSLERRGGIEVKQRWIVNVTRLERIGDSRSELPRPRFQSNVGRPDSRIQFEIEVDKTIIDVVSGFGIDKATIKRESEDWPKTVLVRLHLTGLESFTAGTAESTIEWSASRMKPASRVSLRLGADETVLSKDSPYFTEVRAVGFTENDLRKDCYFEVPLPAKLFEGNPKAISLQWIDFFRN